MSIFLRLLPRKKRNHNLICFLHLGAVSQALLSWSPYLREDVDLYVFDKCLLPSFDDCFSVCEYIVKDAVFREDRPFTLFGHSMGARLAHSLSVYIKNHTSFRQNGLVLSSAIPPSSDVRSLVKCYQDKIFEKYYMRSDYLIRPLPLDLCKDTNSFTAQELRGLLVYGIIDGFTPSERMLSDCDVREIIEQLRLISLFDCFEPESVDVNIYALYGLHDNATPMHLVKLWKEYTSRNFQMFSFSGGHFYYNDSRQCFFRVLNSIVGN